MTKKLVCYTRTANDGHRYVVCNDPSHKHKPEIKIPAQKVEKKKVEKKKVEKKKVEKKKVEKKKTKRRGPLQAAGIEDLHLPYPQFVKKVLANKGYWRQKGFTKLTQQQKMAHVGQLWKRLKTKRDNKEHEKAVRLEDLMAREQRAKELKRGFYSGYKIPKKK
jgi:hypothetical protein